MSDSTGDATYEIKVADGGYIDGLTVTGDDGTSADYTFRYENEAELEASRIAADEAAARANAAAAAAKPYYIQQAEPERTKRVDGMLWVKVNESKKSVDALARWDAGKTGNAIFPGEQTVPGNRTVVDIPGAWTLFDDHRIA